MQKSPLKWPGGKHYLAPQIVQMFPPHIHYVEPYFGSGAVLLASDPEGRSEVVGDLNSQLTNFWECLASPHHFALLYRRLLLTPFSEEHWEAARDKLDEPCQRQDENICYPCAVAFFICCRQSLAGRMQTFAPLSRVRVRRGMNEQASAWIGAIEGLPAVHERLQRVVIRNRPALDLLRQEDGPHTLFYLYPPYLHDTRTSTSEYGAYEMTTQDHAELLDALNTLQGKFILSGYHSHLYDRWAAEGDYPCQEFQLANHAAGGKAKRRMTECLWRNF